VRYKARVKRNGVTICHCTDCQTLSGSPYRAMVMALAEDFEITGEPKIYVKTAESGNKRAQAFCPDCGSAIYSSAPENPPNYSIRLGGIRQRREMGAPMLQIWCDSALSWSADIREAPAKPNG
jgi:hypothetical protein